jgi:hypothetical protein
MSNFHKYHHANYSIAWRKAQNWLCKIQKLPDLPSSFGEAISTDDSKRSNSGVENLNCPPEHFFLPDDENNFHLYDQIDINIVVCNLVFHVCLLLSWNCFVVGCITL